jgi:hypothetical protein
MGGRNQLPLFTRLSVVDRDPRVRPQSAEERRVFDAVAAVVSEELFARIAVGDRLQTAEDADAVAGLITDGLWYRFEIRERQRP